MHEDAGELHLAESIYHEAVARGLWQHWQQRAPHIVSRLVARPWHWPRNALGDPVTEAVGAWARTLEDNFATIRREALAVAAGDDGWEEDYEQLTGDSEHCTEKPGTCVAKPKWRKFVLYRWSYPNEANLRRCPDTEAVLRKGPATHGHHNQNRYQRLGPLFHVS